MRAEADAAGRGPLDADAKETIARLRRVFEAHGYTAAAVRQALGVEIGTSHLRRDLPLYVRRLAAPTPLHTLVKLFTLDQCVNEVEARGSFDPLELAELAALGLIDCGPRGVRALVGLCEYDGLLLAHDRFDEEAPGRRADHVLRVNPPAVTLASLTVRRRVRSTLDLGAGGGVQALLAARHSDRVIAVDKNPRALSFTRFNARLNGVLNVECREGDLFDPVAGCRFDLIVCNPPYVISPDSRYVFQDSGRPGDAICEDVVRRAPAHLEEGGFASILCNWALGAQEEWSAPLRRWVEGAGCDAWLLHSDTQDPLTYAALWNLDRDPSAYGDALDRWLAHYHELGVEAIAMGAVILRRREAGPNWVRADEIPGKLVDSCHEHILRVFELKDHLLGLGDEELLEQAFKLVSDHRLRQTLALREGDYVVEEAELELSGGLRFRGMVDPYTLHLLRRCDGQHALSDVVAEMASRGGADRDQLASAVAGVVRRLVSLGFLVPTEGRTVLASSPARGGAEGEA